MGWVEPGADQGLLGVWQGQAEQVSVAMVLPISSALTQP